MNAEETPIPAASHRLADLLSGRGARPTDLDSDGRIVGGVYHGMTPDEVRADRDAYRRIVGE